MSRIAMVPVIGISGAGKSTIIDNVMALDPEHFHFVKTRTTRDRKPGEDEEAMTFLGELPAAMAELHDEIDRGEYAQFKIHEGNGHFYGTKPEDYQPGKVNLMPTLTSAMPDMEQVGFRSLRPVVVIPDLSSWQRHLQVQEYAPKERLGRLREADESLAYSPKRQHDMDWIHNIEGEQAAVAQTFIDLHRQRGAKNDYTEVIARATRLQEAGVRVALRELQLSMKEEDR